MREFNYEEAKAGKKVCTRNGRPARIVCWDLKDEEYSIVALVEVGNREISCFFTEEGKLMGGKTDSYDLVMASDKKEGWVNLYREEDGTIETSRIRDTEGEARLGISSSRNYIATVKIEWDE